MSLGVYINFNGNCREAVEFYADVFGTEKPKFMTFGDVPPNPEFPHREEIKNLIMHTVLMIHGSAIMFSDISPEFPFQAGDNISLVLSMDNMDEMRTLFQRLKEGGEVEMELQETFWSKLYGYVRDKYGIWWQLSYSGE